MPPVAADDQELKEAFPQLKDACLGIIVHWI